MARGASSSNPFESKADKPDYSDRELGLMENESYLTGWIALGPLIWLCVASLPIFRSKAYEGFWFLHLFAVIGQSPRYEVLTSS